MTGRERGREKVRVCERLNRVGVNRVRVNRVKVSRVRVNVRVDRK